MVHYSYIPSWSIIILKTLKLNGSLCIYSQLVYRTILKTSKRSRTFRVPGVFFCGTQVLQCLWLALPPSRTLSPQLYFRNLPRSWCMKPSAFLVKESIVYWFTLHVFPAGLLNNGSVCTHSQLVYYFYMNFKV